MATSLQRLLQEAERRVRTINAELGHNLGGARGGDHHSSTQVAIAIAPQAGGGGGGGEEHPTPEVVNVFFTDFVIS